jgi:hypothetical protein
MKTLVNLLALAALAAAGAHADGISITLDNPNQSGNPGETLSFYGVITNTDVNPEDCYIYLNSDDPNFTLSDASVSDNFFANVPPYLAPGTSSGDVDLFDITLADPESDPFGTYDGEYTLVGGMDGGADTAQDNLAQVGFSVDVEPASVSAIPEPSTLAQLGTVLTLTILGTAALPLLGRNPEVRWSRRPGPPQEYGRHRG